MAWRDLVSGIAAVFGDYGIDQDSLFEAFFAGEREKQAERAREYAWKCKHLPSYRENRKHIEARKRAKRKAKQDQAKAELKARRKQYYTQEMERIRSDPEKLAAYKERKRANKKAYLERQMSDKKRRHRFRKKCRAHAAAYRARQKAQATGDRSPVGR